MPTAAVAAQQRPAGAIRRPAHRQSACFASMLGAATGTAAPAAPAMPAAFRPAAPAAPGSAVAAPPPLGRLLGRSVGSGQCVALVQATHPGIGRTAGWSPGGQVRGNTAIPPGTPIATFTPAGRYANATDGSSHAALYLGQTAEGVQVLDQWQGSAAAVRTIRWSPQGATASNTGSAFQVIKVAQTRPA